MALGGRGERGKCRIAELDHRDEREPEYFDKKERSISKKYLFLKIETLGHRDEREPEYFYKKERSISIERKEIFMKSIRISYLYDVDFENI